MDFQYFYLCLAYFDQGVLGGRHSCHVYLVARGRYQKEGVSLVADVHDLVLFMVGLHTQYRCVFPDLLLAGLSQAFCWDEK